MSHRNKMDNSIDEVRALGLLTVCLKAGIPFYASSILVYRSAKGKMPHLFERALRKTTLGSSESLEKAIEEEASGLSGEEEGIARYLNEFIRCSGEPDADLRNRLLDRALDGAMESCRKSLKEMVSSLRVPFSTIFAMGIVLPIVVATILPLWGLVSTSNMFDSYYSDSAPFTSVEKDTIPPIILIGIVSILCFPITCVLSVDWIMKNRGQIWNKSMRDSARILLALFVCLGAATVLVSIIARETVHFWIFAGILLTMGILIGRYLVKYNRSCTSKDTFLRASILNSISARISQGEHFVRAVALSDIDRETGRRLFWKSIFPVARRYDGDERDDTWQLIAEASEQDPAISAKMLRQISSHLSDLDMIESEMRNDLRPLAQSALVATIVLCPFVLGMVGGFDSIHPVANDIRGGFEAFEFVFAAFVFETAIIGAWLVGCLSPDGKGMPAFLRKWNYSIALAMGIFSLSMLLSKSMFY